MRFPSSEVISYGEKPDVSETRKPVRSTDIIGAELFSCFSMFSHRRTGLSVSVGVFLTGAYFGKGREPGFGRESGRRPAGKRYSLLCSSFSVSSRSV